MRGDRLRMLQKLGRNAARNRVVGARGGGRLGGMMAVGGRLSGPRREIEKMRTQESQ